MIGACAAQNAQAGGPDRGIAGSRDPFDRFHLDKSLVSYSCCGMPLILQSPVVEEDFTHTLALLYRRDHEVGNLLCWVS